MSQVGAYVYFIKTAASPVMVKIGVAADPLARMADLQTGCPYDLSLAGKIPCLSQAHAFQIEKAAHRVFRKFHKRGEWFTVREDLFHFLDRIIAKQEMCSQVELEDFLIENTKQRQLMKSLAREATKIRMKKYFPHVVIAEHKEKEHGR
jgi:predicted transcriptional regulator